MGNGRRARRHLQTVPTEAVQHGLGAATSVYAPMLALASDGATSTQMALLRDAVQARMNDLGVERQDDLPRGSVANAHRAMRASEVLTLYALNSYGPEQEVHEPLEQVVRDFLTDVMHLIDLMPDKDYGALLKQSRARYFEEVMGE